MTKLWFFIGMENYFTPLFIGEYWACRNELMRSLYFEDLSFCFVPNEYFNIFNSLISFSKIILKMCFTLAFIKIAFRLFLFDLCNVDPFIFIETLFGDSKYIILKNPIMLALARDGLESWWLLYSPLLIVFEFVIIWGDGLVKLRCLYGDEYFFDIFGIGVWNGVRVVEFKYRIGDHFYTRWSRKFS